MRKIIAGFILTAMLFTFGLCACGTQNMTAYAADKMNISLSSVSGKPGDTVTVEINIANNPGFNTLKLKIGYDSHDLTLVSAENSGILSGMQYVGSQTIDKNPYVMVWAQAGNVTEDGKAGVLTFKINDGAYSGDAEFSFACEFCTDQNQQHVDVSVSSGAVSISGGSDRPAEGTDSQSENGRTLWPLWFLLLIPIGGVAGYVVYRKKSKKQPE